jgi:tetratricopeptide (TPR) repeat protein
VTAAGLLFVSSLALLSLWFHLVSQANHAISAKNRQVELGELQAMKLNRLLQSVIEPADPLGLNTLTRDMALPPAAEAAASRYLISRLSEFVNEAELEQAPRVRASLLRTLGNAHRSIGEFGKAEPCLREAVTLGEQYLTANDPDLAAAYLQYGWLLQDQADLSGAMGQYRKALGIQLGRTSPDALAVAAVEFNMAYLNMFTGEGVESERLFRHVIDTRERHLGRDHRLVAVSKLALSMLYLDRDRVGDAQPLIHEAAAILARQPSAEALHRACVEFEGAVINARLGRSDEAIATLRNLVQLISGSNLGEHHWVMGFIRFELGSIYRKLGRYDEAIAELARTRDIGVALAGWKHPKLTEVIDALADTYADKGELPAACRTFDELIQKLKALFPDGHVFTADALAVYAAFLKSQKRPAEAEALVDEALAIYGRPAELTGRRHGPALKLRAQIRAERGRHADALADLDAAGPLFDRLVGPQHPAKLHLRVERAVAMAHVGRQADAIAELEAILAGRDQRDAVDADVVYDGAMARARLAFAAGRPADGEGFAARAAGVARGHFPKNPAAAARAELLRADLAIAAGQPGKAAAALAAAQLKFEENKDRNRDAIADTLHRRAVLALSRDQVEAATRIHGDLIDFARAHGKAGAWRMAARSVLLAADGDLNAVAAVLNVPNDWKPSRTDAQTVGAFQVLTGSPADGRRLLRIAKAAAADRPTPWEDVFLALAAWKSGDRDAARQQFAAAEVVLPSTAPKPAWNDTSGWVAAAELKLARDRVAQLLKE